MRTYEGLWCKRQFVPCWVIQSLCVGILGVVSSLLVGASTVVLTAGRGSNGFTWLGFTVDEVAKVTMFVHHLLLVRIMLILCFCRVVGSLMLTFCIVTLAFDITECMLYRKCRLSPAIVLIFGCIKTIMWLMYFIFVVWVATRGTPSPLDLILGIILVTTSIGQVVLGATYTHKQRKGLLGRGNYTDLEEEGKKRVKPVSIPRSNTWRKSIPATTIDSQDWLRRSNGYTDYESFRNSLIQAEMRRESIQQLEGMAQPEAETQTLASSSQDDSITGLASPPTSPGLTTALSHPPIHRVYQPTQNPYDFDQADLALTGFYGAGVEGETKRW